VPPECIQLAITAIQLVSQESAKTGSQRNFKRLIRSLVNEPEKFTSDRHFADLATALVEHRDFQWPEPIHYKTWGAQYIEQAPRDQLELACSMPDAAAAALMPDAHLGYAVPIGTVFATRNTISPYVVGVDICCSMQLSVLDLPVPDKKPWTSEQLDRSLWDGTRFGLGCEFKKRQQHEVMDDDWTVSDVTKTKKDKAWRQLGTSGGGNHFVEYGLLTIDDSDNGLGVEPGQYVALMSHSGSRGVGLSVCDFYSEIARQQTPQRYEKLIRQRLTWLSLDSQAGQEYWQAMTLMGQYARANHDLIHRNVSRLVGAEILGSVYNSHNFAWKEEHQGETLIVHRKGATPAAEGQLGVIPGSMGTPGYVVRGRGNPDSLQSASHGAGRCMSRKKARETFDFQATKKNLEKEGIRILQAGADEVPGVYKEIEAIMAAQQDLVEIVARFDPRVVMMAADKAKPWQKKKHGNDADW
jgi:tRNA-splicing ligase RtcB